MPKPTPFDAMDLETIRTAQIFVTFLQVRPGERIHEEYPTQAEAARLGLELANAHRRPVMIYAVSPAGRSVLVETISPTPRQKD